MEQAQVQGANIVVFPEYVTLELTDLWRSKLGVASAFRRVSEQFHGKYLELFSKLAKQFGVFIVAGSTLENEGRKYYNTCFFFTPWGRVAKHRKLHLHPVDKAMGVNAAGNSLQVLSIERFKVGILTCYDIVFPEVARILVLKGAQVIFVPLAAPSEVAFLDLRTCGEARTIENQVLIVQSCLVGRMPGLGELEFYGKSSILYPGKKRALSDGKLNEEILVTADVDLRRLNKAKKMRFPPVLKDLRADVYSWLCKRGWR
jgi:predicted amidohydrolase